MISTAHSSAGDGPYVHEVRIRYGECDMQRVVFNAHYFAYCDDAVDTWFRSVLGAHGLAIGDDAIGGEGFDFMLKKAELIWHAPLVFGEHARLACSVARWGTTSFDVAIEGTAGDDPRFSATLTYVSVVPHENTPTPLPASVRNALGG